MKKFFALMLALAMVAFAGMAFAADEGGHVDIDPVSGKTGTERARIAVETIQNLAYNVVTVVESALKAVDPAAVVAGAFNSLSTSLRTAAEDLGMTQAEIAVWEGRLNAIQAAVTGGITLLQTTIPGFAGDVLRGMGDAVITALPGTLDTLINQASARLQALGEAADSSVAAAASATDRTAIAVLPSITPSASGIFNLSVPTFKQELFGMPIAYHPFPNRALTRAATTVFLNSKGEQVTTIPGRENEDVMPGFVSIVTYMEAGVEYRPVISTTVGAVQAEPGLSQTIATVTYTETIQVASNSTFSTYVPTALLAETEYVTIPVSAVSSTGWSDTDAESEFKEDATNYNIYTLAAFPALSGLSTEVWYIAAVSFDRGEKTASDLYTGAGLTFYPNNVLQASNPSAVFYKASNGSLVELTASEILGATSRYTQGYIAFQLSSGTSATKPAITTMVKKSGSTPSPVNPGSSSGGCSAGFSALALAVLAGFVAKRKK